MGRGAPCDENRSRSRAGPETLNRGAAGGFLVRFPLRGLGAGKDRVGGIQPDAETIIIDIRGIADAQPTLAY